MSQVGARPHPLKNPYAYDDADIQVPPRTLPQILRRIGPGMILAASIVGSGELIATTTLGAEVGYVALWVIILSCALKPAIQAEIGRHSVATGRTGLAGFNHVPGPRWKVNWIVWGWAAMILMTRFQIGAMYGGVAQALHQVFPVVPVTVWVIALLALTLALLLGGGYERIEKLAMVKVVLFTMLTFLCALLLIRRPDDFSWGQLLEGLRFQLPSGGLASAVAVFGITGVGASELFMYPYWCVEKGYARFSGRRDETPAWRSRAFGWIKVMHVDILASMIIYTIATVAFYLLGAGILHSRGLVPNATEMIPRLSNMYTETLGGWAVYLFYPGAMITLYGTIFAATAAESRVGADMCRLLGFFQEDDYAARVRFRRRFVWGLTVIGAGLYLIFESPVNMVKIGGVAQAVMLPVIAVGALFMRYRLLPRSVWPKWWITFGLWVAAITTICLMAYYAVLTLR
ncbi:MAG: Nramp family divalent metal transporter [Bryobacteraceae bacterium]|nr:Nramp family divalent metal transporter [Bryobacteraceae bacterium]